MVKSQFYLTKEPGAERATTDLLRRRAPSVTWLHAASSPVAWWRCRSLISDGDAAKFIALYPSISASPVVLIVSIVITKVGHV